MQLPVYYLLLGLFLLGACKKTGTGNPPAPEAPLYFPPVSGTQWETTAAPTTGWTAAQENDLAAWLQTKNTKAFIVLHKGRIVTERYFGSFTADSNWYWASAGKTLTAFLVGIAQEEGLLRLSDRTSQYLGNGWTSMPLAKEQLITVRHQLTMSTGLENNVPDDDCTLPACLQYRADAGTRWFYHNAPYTLLEKVVEQASGRTYNQYFQEKIRNRIGMNGLWLRTGAYNNVYYSNARSMARVGLLLLAKGRWAGTPILGDTAYVNAISSTSQNLNLSYGYLTWLNGKTSHMLPATSLVFSGILTPNAPPDMYAALGKNDQKIYVVPSRQLVVIRMGESAGNVQLAVSSFDNELWGRLRVLLGY